MMDWSNFHFLRPWWLMLLPLALLFVFKPLFKGHKKTSWERVIEPHLLSHLLQDRRPRRRSLAHSLGLFTFLVLAALSLAGPTKKKIPHDVAFYKSPLVICLEISPHMLSKDLNPSRFKRAMFKLEDLLREYQGAEVALIAFAGDAHLVVPLSNDYNTILTMAKTLTPDLMPIKGVNLKGALSVANEIVKKNHRAHVVVMTSSNFDDEAFDLPPLSNPHVIWAFATNAGSPLERADGRFDQGREGAVTISKLRADKLAQLSSVPFIKTLVFTPDRRDIATILGDSAQGSPVASKREEMYDQWYDLGPYVLALAMVVLFFALIFSRERAFLLALIFMVPSKQSEASIMDWFLRRDQQAQRAMDQAEHEKAAELFDDNFQKGTAYYRAKKFDEAIKQFQSVNTSDGQYNLGNAFAQKGDYHNAIAAYEKALQMNPNNEDARANKELLQRNQQQEKNQQQQKKESSEQEKEPSGDKSDEQSEGEKQKEQSKPSSSPPQPENESASQKKEQEREQKKGDGAGAKPEEKEERGVKGEQPKEVPLGDKLDPQTRHYFQRLEQHNNLFLKRKFHYESQKRQGAQ